ncbi:hypothetical protein RND81_08G109100 [Saponaria officinalis]|uniref:Reverse transcriptase zinc-binding domain-containing protein n=1 Tax=Saponaria officinalis TaxID=3572 RepID=A0AAW1J6W1_SAPOF
MKLINYVIFGIENFWSSCLLIPAGVLQKLKKLCRDFFWSFGSNSGKKLILKSWDSICVPKEEGGFGIKEVLACNMALLSRWIWRLVMAQGDLWSSWISSYTLRQQSVWTVTSKQSDAECWRSILKVRDYILERTWYVVADAERLVKSWVKGDSFDTSTAYQFFRKVQPQFYGAKALWAMVNWCVLCKSSLENVGHLFFRCDYSNHVWHHVLIWMGFTRRAWALSREFDWVIKQVRRRQWRSQWLQVTFVSAIHYLWIERNRRIFMDCEMERATLISRIKFHVSVWVLYRAKGAESEILDALNRC